MPSYHYEAKDNTGAFVEGTIEAATETEAAAEIVSKGHIPLLIEEESTSVDIKKYADRLLGRGKVQTDAMVLFCRQVAVLIKAGVPVIAALQRIQETTESEPLANALTDVIERITGGQTLTASIKNHPQTFPPVMVSLVDAGENSGRLDLSFQQLAEFFQLQAKTVKRIKAATRYPIIILVAIVIAMVVVNFMVIPAFSRMFAQFGEELPLATRMLLASSNFMIANWYLLLAGVIGAFFALRAYIQTPSGAVTWDGFKLKIPVIGNVLRRIILGRFSRTFAMILKAGVPLVDGITLSANAMGNLYMSQRVISMRDGLARGEALSRSAADTGLFTPLVLQMLLVGEDTGQMDDMLAHVAEFYEEEVEYDLSQLSTLLEPIILSILGVMILILALGIFLPMWDMAKFAQ